MNEKVFENSGWIRRNILAKGSPPSNIFEGSASAFPHRRNKGFRL
jgi:hypothetical protein